MNKWYEAGEPARINSAISEVWQEKYDALKQQNSDLLEALDVFFKVVVVDGKQYRPGFPLCAGCDELTLARGWECYYKPETTECKYPDDIIKAAKVEGE